MAKRNMMRLGPKPKGPESDIPTFGDTARSVGFVRKIRKKSMDTEKIKEYLKDDRDKTTKSNDKSKKPNVD